jgi:hypothetical protein
MTQDPYGQPPGDGHVVRGEVVPDDEADANPPTVPLTHFQKVASALRGDRTDPTGFPADVPPGHGQSGATTAPGPDQASPEDVGAVRSPDAGNRDYWDGDDTDPDGLAAEDPTMTQPDLYGTTAPRETEAAETAEPSASSEAAAAPPVAAAEPAVEPESMGRHAGAPAQAGLRPGEPDSGLRDFSDLTYGSLLPDAAEFKARWQQVQFRFVDDPQGSVTEAADVIAQVTAKLEAAIQERQRAISDRQRTLRDRWSEGKSTDTESLRETLLMYRAFLDQLTGPKIS